MKYIQFQIGNKFWYLLLLSVLATLSCSNSNDALQQSISEFSEQLIDINEDELRQITTESGFTTIMLWSDSLRNKHFLNELSKNLDSSIFRTVDLDSIIILSLGKSDLIVGTTGGTLKLRTCENGYKIDQFLGGK